jgi:RimJ/RimL family protein N-acetyltransferase
MSPSITAPERLDGSLVYLRPLEPGDLAAYAQSFADDPELAPACGIDEDPDEAQLQERLDSAAQGLNEGRWVELATIDRESDRYAGGVILHSFDWRHEHTEVGLWLVPEFRGGGRATEAVRLIVDWAFNQLGMNRVEMITLPAMRDYDQVITLAERLGFRQEGIMRERNFERGRRLDTTMLAVLRDEWDAAATAG